MLIQKKKYRQLKRDMRMKNNPLSSIKKKNMWKNEKNAAVI